MWHDLIVAVGMVLVIEGVLPFVNPDLYRRMIMALSQLEDGQLRFAGLSIMILGCVVLYLVRAFS